MRRPLLASLALLVGVLPSSACGDGDCVDGVCPDVAQTRPVPGPCESAYETPSYANHCRYRYDGERSTKIECSWHEKGDGGENGTETSTRTYDAAGQLLQLDYAYDDTSDAIGSSYGRWKFTPTEVQYFPGSWSGFGTSVGRTYDRATFAFLPTPGSFALQPRAELGLVSDRTATYTWTREGMTLTRTGGGATATFVVDDRGRIIEMHAGSANLLYTFDGDLLVRRETLGAEPQVETFEYDAGGNLAIWSSDTGLYEVYNNSCW